MVLTSGYAGPCRVVVNKPWRMRGSAVCLRAGHNRRRSLPYTPAPFVVFYELAADGIAKVMESYGPHRARLDHVHGEA